MFDGVSGGCGKVYEIFWVVEVGRCEKLESSWIDIGFEFVRCDEVVIWFVLSVVLMVII